MSDRSRYVEERRGGVLPGMTVLAVFRGLSFAPTMNAALRQLIGQDSSLASGFGSGPHC